MATREAIKAALSALCSAAQPAALLRGFSGPPDRPSRLTPGGAILLEAIDEPDPEVDLNPVTYHKEPRFILLLIAATQAQTETMARAIGAAIEADRTLGGAAEWTDAGDFAPDDATDTGSVGQIEARLTVTANYATTNPLA